MIVSQQLAETRRWAFYSLGARMLGADTGRVHGPEAEPYGSISDVAYLADRATQHRCA